MVSAVKFTLVLLIIVLINLAQGAFTNVPPPPTRPPFFHSKEELIRYLQKVHEYHLIVGRWRLRRGFNEHQYLHSSNNDLFKFFDSNNDHIITKSEFNQQLSVRDENK
ncbi:unnamed protein product [Adineta steineri]|uniref:EF-hand domain-containing protein n=1 Tax=Adineta steineri TaxID=433720 RepID=A0A815P1V6_9BILA|nr:unnamed protein product [Adineta steineri]CAF3819951.1 unnamed protein product [Adineta steineri]